MNNTFEISSSIVQGTDFSKSDLRIENYKKCIVVYGPILDYKRDLRRLGGTYCSKLNNKYNNEKCSGFVFNVDKRELLEEFILN